MSEVVGLANLSAFQRDVLWTLAEESGLKGVAIKRRLEDYYGDHVNHAQLYPNLDDLVDLGLVEKAHADGRTNAYSLTEAGRRALSARQVWTGGAAAA